ncbi:unnamed protein product [Arctogadus glacialis]
MWCINCASDKTPAILHNKLVYWTPTSDYPHGIRLSAANPGGERKVLMVFTAPSQQDRLRFTSDLRESIAEVQEMDKSRLEAELEKQKGGGRPGPLGGGGSTTGGAASPGGGASPAGGTKGEGVNGILGRVSLDDTYASVDGLKRTALSSSLRDLSDTGKRGRRNSVGSLDSTFEGSVISTPRCHQPLQRPPVGGSLSHTPTMEPPSPSPYRPPPSPGGGGAPGLGHAQGGLGHAQGGLGHAQVGLSHSQGGLGHAQGGLGHAQVGLSHSQGGLSHSQPGLGHAHGGLGHAQVGLSHSQGGLGHAQPGLGHAQGQPTGGGGGFLGNLFGSRRGKVPGPLVMMSAPPQQGGPVSPLMIASPPHYPAPAPPLPTALSPCPSPSPHMGEGGAGGGPSKLQALHAQYCHGNSGGGGGGGGGGGVAGQQQQTPPPPYHHHHRYHLQDAAPPPRRPPPHPHHRVRYGFTTPPPLSPHSPMAPPTPHGLFHSHTGGRPGGGAKLPLTVSHSQPHPHAHMHAHSQAGHGHAHSPLSPSPSSGPHFLFSTPPPQTPSARLITHTPYPPLLSTIPPPPPHSPLPPPATPLSPHPPTAPGGGAKSKPISRISTVV